MKSTTLSVFEETEEKNLFLYKKKKKNIFYLIFENLIEINFIEIKKKKK
jgi:hypothetical protein